jgi:hypothetical protein
MLPKYHALFGFIFASILLFIFPKIGILGFVTIWLASFLIDVDHYLFYAITKKDWSLKNAHKWFVDENKKFMKLSYWDRLKNTAQIPCILHGIEAIIILLVLSLLSNTFLYIAIGFIFHQSLDFIFLIYYGFTLKHLGSQTYNILKYKKIP